MNSKGDVGTELRRLVEANVSTPSADDRSSDEALQTYAPRVEAAQTGVHRRSFAFAAAACLIVVAIGVAAILASSGPGDPQTFADAPKVEDQGLPPSATDSSEVPLTPEEVAEMNRVLDEQIASGWVPYGFTPVLEDASPMPTEGWIEVNGKTNFDNLSKPVYDSPNGSVIGYHYTNLGFVSLADNDRFDPHAARIERFGCDKAVDPKCETAPEPNE